MLRQGRRRHLWNRACHGATLVEFALVAPLFFFLVFAMFAGTWYVLEVSAVTNAAREAVRWEIATSNFTSSADSPTPWCAVSSGSNVPVGMTQAAQATAGPFASEITAATITNTATYNTLSQPDSCTVTLAIPYLPLVSLVPGLPSRISTTFTSALD